MVVRGKEVKRVNTRKGNLVPTVEQPCIRKCCLNEEDVCLGCFRTFDNMLVWNKSTHSQKVEMLKKVQERRSLVEKRRAEKRKKR